jgi:membrane-associated phospholipid phosphatase
MYETMIAFGLDAIRWLQMTYPQLTAFMQVVSDFGRFEFYLIVLPFVYWCLNKRFGLHLTYLLVLSALLNGIFKHWWHQPRPFWLDRSLSADDALDYGAPSGHVQIVTTATFFLAAWFRQGWLWIFAVVCTLLMAISRVYLGVHFVHDVVIGFLLGIIILCSYAGWRYVAHERYKQRIFGQRLLLAAATPLTLYVFYLLVIWLRGEPNWGSGMRQMGLAAEAESFEAVIQYTAILFGIGIGFTFEKNRVCFKSEGVLWKRIVRYLIGMAIAVLIWRGGSILTDIINPNGSLWLNYPLRFVRYMLLGLWLAYYAPLLFVALNLADHSIEPELPYQIEGTALPNNKNRRFFR